MLGNPRLSTVKGTVMQTEKVLIHDRLRVSKVSWKFHISIIYNFAVITREICYFLKKYFLTVSIVFSVYKQNPALNNLKTRTAVNAKLSVLVIGVEAIIYLLLHNLHDCNFKFKKYIKTKSLLPTLKFWSIS